MVRNLGMSQLGPLGLKGLLQICNQCVSWGHSHPRIHLARAIMSLFMWLAARFRSSKVAVGHVGLSWEPHITLQFAPLEWRLIERKKERVWAREKSQSSTLISEVTSYCFCGVYSFRVGHSNQLTLRRGGLHKDINTTRWGSLGGPLRSSHHNMTDIMCGRTYDQSHVRLILAKRCELCEGCDHFLSVINWVIL